VFKKRNVLHGDLKAALNTSGLDVAKVERLLTAIESTYKLPSSKVPRLALWVPYLHLMRTYAVGNDLAKLAALVMKGLACLGFVIMTHPAYLLICKQETSLTPIEGLRPTVRLR
jgi:hypothetical protein